MAGCDGVEIASPVSISLFPLKETGFRIEIMFIVFRSFQEIAVIIGFTHVFCHLGNSPIINGIFKSFGYRFRFFVKGNKFLVFNKLTASFVIECCFPNSLIGQFLIKSCYAFKVGINNYWYSIVSNHHPVVKSHQMPLGKFTFLLKKHQHGVDKIRCSFGLNEGKKRVGCTVCVPQRKSSIIIKHLTVINFFISTQVIAVHIVIQGRGNHGVVESCIEYAAGYFVGLDLNLA